MALVRVYCGLASADESARAASAAQLTIAVVDDAGRLLGIHEISDDPGGYAELGALLVARTSGFTDAAVAVDSDDHVVTSLLTAAGRPLVVADDDSTDDFAERFADDSSIEEMQAPPAARRAVGLARALQAGAHRRGQPPTPRELVSYKPVLAAHVALLNGRHGRRRRPARGAARALPGRPAGLSRPGPPAGHGRPRRAARAEPARRSAASRPERVAEQVVAELSRSRRRHRGRDHRRGHRAAAWRSASRPAAAGSTSRWRRPRPSRSGRPIAAVRACDAACAELIGTLAERRPGRDRPGRRPPRPPRRRAGPAAVGAAPADTNRFGGRRSRPEPAATGSGPVTPQPLNTPPAAPEPMMPPPLAPRPVTPPPAVPAASAAFPNRRPRRATGRSRCRRPRPA